MRISMWMWMDSAMITLNTSCKANIECTELLIKFTLRLQSIEVCGPEDFRSFIGIVFEL